MNSNNNNKCKPRFRIFNTSLQILDSLMNQEMTIPSEFHNKEIMLWMARNDRIAKISLSNYSGTLTTNTNRRSFQSNSLNIGGIDIYV